MLKLILKLGRNNIYKLYKKRDGLVQIPLIIGLVVMAVALPLATKMTQQSNDNRSSAAGISEGSMCCPTLDNLNPCAEGLSCEDISTSRCGVCKTKSIFGGGSSGGGGASRTWEVETNDCRETGCKCGEQCQSDAGIWSCMQIPKKNFIVYKNGSCQTSANTYACLDECNNSPPTGNCYNTLAECNAAHPGSGGSGGGGGSTSYTCTSNGGYCTSSSNPHIGVFNKTVSGTCPSGETCVGCAANNNQCVKDPADSSSYKMTTGNQINTSNGTGCWKTCTPNSDTCTSGTPFSAIRWWFAGTTCISGQAGNNCRGCGSGTKDCYETQAGCMGANTIPNSCESKGGYCTASSNPHIGVFNNTINGVCPDGQTCVGCMPNNNKCVKDPADSSSYKMTTGNQINTSNGTGCWKTCTPTSDTCESKGGYCTDANNPDIASGFIKVVDGTCSNNQACVNCETNSSKAQFNVCRSGKDGYKYAIQGRSINTSNGTGCTSAPMPNDPTCGLGNCNVCSSFDNSKNSGDFDCSGSVNLADFSTWKYLKLNCSDKVTDSDFNNWKNVYIK